MQTTSTEKLGIKDGTYQGLWSGYSVKIVEEKKYNGFFFSTKDGVRGLDIPVIIEVKNGQAVITEEK